jgi:hypothetical protein
MVIIYFSGVNALLSYHDKYFARLRAPLEPILLSLALLPICLLIDYLIKDFRDKKGL